MFCEVQTGNEVQGNKKLSDKNDRRGCLQESIYTMFEGAKYL
jgi:hypothetical protein